MHLSARGILSKINTVLAGTINIYPYQFPKSESRLLAGEMRDIFFSLYCLANKKVVKIS